MTLEQLLNVISFFQIGVVVKLFILVGLLFYFVYTVVVYREVSLMTQVLNSSISPFIRNVAIIQIIVVAGVFFLAVFLI